jgi:hypothetical protein
MSLEGRVQTMLQAEVAFVGASDFSREKVSM